MSSDPILTSVLNGQPLPLPSSSSEIGRAFPVGGWSLPNTRVAYLLELCFDPARDDGSPVKYDIHIFSRERSSRWELVSSGGADWIFGTQSPPHSGDIWFMSSGIADPEHGDLFVAPGFAGDRVQFVEVNFEGWTTQSLVHRETGAFLVGGPMNAPMTLVTIDPSGKRLNYADHTSMWELVHRNNAPPLLASSWLR